MTRKMFTGTGTAKVMFIVTNNYEGILLTNAVHCCITVNVVYYRNLLEHCIPKCVVSDHIVCGQDLLCYATVLSASLPTQ